MFHWTIFPPSSESNVRSLTYFHPVNSKNKSVISVMEISELES
jgi:hypothetical protein